MDNISAAPVSAHQPPEQGQSVVSALFADSRDAQAAVRELREVGIPADSISLISRDEDHNAEPELSGVAGVSHEDISDEALAYRASDELPNDEDLPTTEAQMTEYPKPFITDYEVPPDQIYGGAERLGLTPDRDKVRRNEAETRADEDIYTDFPDEPGGVNPDSPVANRAAADVQEPMKDRTSAGDSAAVGAGLGGIAGLLVGLAGLAIPGVGPFIAAGPLAAALGSILAGGAAGGVIGALSTVGVPEEYAREYAASIQQGQTLLSVRADTLTQDLVERVLIANGGNNLS